MAKVCANCNKEMGIFTGKAELADGWICTSCYEKAGLNSFSPAQILAVKELTSEDMRRMIRGLNPLTEEDRILAPIRAENRNRMATFVPTSSIGNLVAFDDKSMEFFCTDGDLVDFFKYENIVDYELLQNGGSISKGSVGSAIVGGALFGATGAIVGAASGPRTTVDVCDSLCIKITLRDTYKQIAYINFITKRIPTNLPAYKEAYVAAQNCMSLFKLACDKVEPARDEGTGSLSQADEIRKFKQLLDDGIITEEEFQMKKRQLLGI